MRGQVLYYYDNTGNGQIEGADGKRYGLLREDLRNTGSVQAGDTVEFKIQGDRARHVLADRPAPGPDRSPSPAPAAAAAPDLGLFAYFLRAYTSDYLNFRGRARRKEVWAFVLFTVLFSLVLGMIAGILLYAAGDPALDPGRTGPTAAQMAVTFGIIGIGLLTLPPMLAVTARRLHDLGQSAWWIVLFLLIGVFWLYGYAVCLLVVSLIDSQAGGNRFGPSPKPPAQPASGSGP